MGMVQEVFRGRGRATPSVYLFICLFVSTYFYATFPWQEATPKVACSQIKINEIQFKTMKTHYSSTLKVLLNKDVLTNQTSAKAGIQRKTIYVVVGGLCPSNVSACMWGGGGGGDL